MGIGRVAGGGECYAQRRRHVHHRGGGVAGGRGRLAGVVGERGHHRDGLALVGLGDHVGRPGGTADVGAVILPLVADGAVAAGPGTAVVGGERRGRRQGVGLDAVAGGIDRDGQRRRHVHHRGGGVAGGRGRLAGVVGERGHHRDGLALVGLVDHVGRPGGTADVGAVILPLVADGAVAAGPGAAVVGGERRGRRQGVGLDAVAGGVDRDAQRRRHVHHRGGGVAGGRGRLAGVVGERGHHRDGLALVGLGDHVGRPGGAADVGAVVLPLVGDVGGRVVAVGRQRRGRRQGVGLDAVAGGIDRDRQRRRHVHHRGGGVAGGRGRLAGVVGERGHHRDGLALVGLGDHVGRPGGAADVGAVVLPLVGDVGGRVVAVGRQRRGRRQGVGLDAVAGGIDRDRQRRRHVHHRGGGVAGGRGRLAGVVGERGHHRDGLALVGLGDHVGRPGGAADVGAVVLPLVGDVGGRVVAVGRQRRGRRQGVGLDAVAGGIDRDRQRRRHVHHRGGGVAGGRGRLAGVVGERGHHRDGLALVGLVDHVGRPGGTADVGAVILPLVADGAVAAGPGAAVVGGERRGRRQGVGLDAVAGGSDRDRQRRRHVHHRGGGVAGGRGRLAGVVGERGHHRDG